MTGLAEFLLARIGEDEAAANHAHWAMQGAWFATAEDKVDEFVRRNSPARVLAECEAKRRIVELHKEVLIERPDDDVGIPYDALCDVDDDDFPCDTLRLLALPYADHDDYREEWRP